MADVRSVDDFAAGHIPGSVNLPMATLIEDVRRRASAEQTIVVVGGTAEQSARAAALLRQNGYADVTDFGPASNWQGAWETGTP